MRQSLVRACISYVLVGTFLIACGDTAAAASKKKKSSSAHDNAEDFSLTSAYLAALASAHTIQPTFKMKIGDHSGLHRVEKDCEMHLAAEPVGYEPGEPASLVIEPPNLCKLDTRGQVASMSAEWAGLFDNMNGADCEVKGFPRIFTEHAQNGGDASNPLHVLEVHPATSIACPGKTLKFGKEYLRVFDGMPSIKEKTAAGCFENRSLKVRYDTDSKMYQFQEEGGQCGNFAILEVMNVPSRYVQDVGDGHSAIARMSPDGESNLSVKIYTIAPSAIDSWLASLKTKRLREKKILLGLLTYDYFSIQKVLYDRTTKKWQKPTDWTDIPYPISFVAYGEVSEAPWSE